tara:strand:- start:3187 stop:3795 length:609 start_codon:yes stop_codon:yes gene_type:complete
MLKKIFIILSLVYYFFFPIPLFASEESAIFAGGCFWCLEHDLEVLTGVIDVKSGYSGGDLQQPTYKNHNGHQESVLVQFDTNKISYKELLRAYWRNVDPLDNNGQFCDKGESYKPIIFTNNQDQINSAKLSLNSVSTELNLLPENIKVQILPAKKFWIAENYHQDYAKNNNVKYKFYRYSCGRDKRLKEVWGEKASRLDPWS